MPHRKREPGAGAGVPAAEEVLEAADIDGATAWQKFRLVTLRLIMPAILIADTCSTTE